jgi:PPP family 3-phenylpropionic acid transporter
VSIPLSLRAVWFVYGSVLGIFFPFFALYVHENAGLAAHEVGLVNAMFPLVGLIAQPFWGRIADRSGERARVLASITGMASLGYAILPAVSGFPAIAATAAFLALSASAVVPMATSVSLAVLGSARADAFGRARMFATIGFLVAVALLPLGLHALPPADSPPPGVSEPRLALVFALSAVLSLVAAAWAYAIPRGSDEALRAQRGDWRELFRERSFVTLLAVTLLGYFFTIGPNALFPLLVAARGGGVETVSQMWIVMLAVEIPLVAYSGTALRKLGPQGLLALGIGAAGARWALTGLFDDPRIVVPVQALHGVSVVGLVIGSSLCVDALVPAKLRSSAQGVLGMVSVSIAGVASNVVAGLAYEGISPAAPFSIGGLCAIALSLLVLRVPQLGRQPSTAGSSLTPTGQ